MCGIAGIIKLTGELRDSDTLALQNALLAQKHRGPDARSFWSDSKIALGHNRLSIIDLSTAANQPFDRPDLGLKIIFNGEIYNYQNIKKDLEELGHSFLTTSDTEVLLVAFREYGQKLTERLVGMFAFVIYDLVNDTIFAARDRFGEKPFFYILHDQTFYFSSELAALRELYPHELTINPQAVVDLMENMYINQHHTIYSEVQVFPAAHQLEISEGKLKWDCYYSFPKNAKENLGFEKLRKEVRLKLFQIVENELHADVPVATFLSSGIDSSVITAIAKEIKPDILAITMSTGDPHSDEAADATRFAKKLDIRQEIITVDPSSLEILGQLLQHMQPLADASLIPTHLVTRSVASHTKVMLSGDAGDEVFGSYGKPNLYQKYGSKPFPLGASALNFFGSISPEFSEKYLNDKNRFKLGGWPGFYSKNNLTGIFSKVFLGQNPEGRVLKVARDLEIQYRDNPAKLSFGVDLMTRLPGDFLFKVDAAAMYSSLEVRVPFLDHTLVDLSLSSSLTSLMPTGKDKEITRSLYSEFAGYEHQGSKKGFSIPYLKYLLGSWGDLLETYLNDGLSQEYLSLNKKGIIGLVEEFRSSPSQRLARVLFSVLVLEIWLRVFHLRKAPNFQIS